MAIKFIESVNMNNALYVNGVNQRVGIGLENPQAQLHIDDSSNDSSGLRFTTVGSGTSDEVNFHFQGTAGSAPFYISRENTGGAEIRLQRNGDVLLNGTGKGNVGVNTLSPEQILHVEGHVLVSGSSTSDTMTLRSTATSSTASAPDLKLRRNRSATSGATHGVVEFQGYAYNSSTLKSFGGIYSRIYSGSDNWSLITLSTHKSSTYDHVANFGLTSSSEGGVILNPPAQDTPPSKPLDVRGDAIIDGRLGVETSNPIEQLHVVGSQVRLDSGTGGYYIHNAGGSFRAAFWDNGTNTRIFGDGNGSTAAMTIDSGKVTFPDKVGVGLTPVEVLDLQTSSGDCRIRLDAPSGSDTEIKFFNNAVAQYTIGHDDATDNFVIGGANVDAPMVSINKSGNLGIKNTSPSALLHMGSNSLSGSTNVDIALQNSSRHYSINNVSGDLNFRDESAGTQRMQIASSGNVGIGSDADSNNKLKVNGNLLVANHIYLNSGTSNSIVGVGGGIEFYTNSTKRVDIDINGDLQVLNNLQFSTGGNNLITGSSGDMVFKTNNVERMKITAGGAVQLDVDGANIGFDVDGTSRFYQTGVSTSDPAIIARHNGTVTSSTFATMIQFQAGTGTVRGSIKTSATSTQYNTSSDYRLKKNFNDFNGLDLVSQIPVYDFNWRAPVDPEQSQGWGVKAHELQEVMPNAVSGEKDGEEMQGVDYSKIVPVLVKAIQELEQKVKDLESKS